MPTASKASATKRALKGSTPALLALDLGPVSVDLNRLVDFHPDPRGAMWESVEGSKRCGLRGKSLGTIGLRHAGGYEVLLQLEDGTLATFSPQALQPLRTSPAAAG